MGCEEFSVVLLTVNGYAERIKLVSLDAVERTQSIIQVWLKAMHLARFHHPINIMFLFQPQSKVWV